MVGSEMNGAASVIVDTAKATLESHRSSQTMKAPTLIGRTPTLAPTDLPLV